MMKQESEKRRVSIGMVQMRCSDDAEKNRRNALSMTREAAAEGANVVCLPELFRSRYFCQSEDDPRYYEKYYFTPGDLGFKIFGTERAALGVLICWD